MVILMIFGNLSAQFLVIWSKRAIKTPSLSHQHSSLISVVITFIEPLMKV